MYIYILHFTSAQILAVLIYIYIYVHIYANLSYILHLLKFNFFFFNPTDLQPNPSGQIHRIMREVLGRIGYSARLPGGGRGRGGAGSALPTRL